MVRCPKCGHEQPFGDQCARCGVIFSRYRPRPAAPVASPAPVAPTETPTAPAGPTRSRGSLRLFLRILATLCALFAAVFFVVFSMVKRSEPYQRSQTLIRQSPAIRELVGPDVQLGWLFSGSIETSGPSGQAELQIPVHGPKGSTSVSTVWIREGGVWQLQTARYVDGSGKVRPLVTQPEEHAVETVPQESPAQQHLAAGHRFFSHERFAEAIAEYDKALAAGPPDAEIYYWRGIAAARTGDEERAIADLRRSIDLSPGRIDSYVSLDRLLTRRSAWDEIITLWTSLIERDPTNAQAYVERAGAYRYKGDRENALRDAQKACELGEPHGCALVKRYGLPAG